MGGEFEGRLAGDIAGLRPYQPGKPIEALKREFKLSRVVKLASNENPLGASPEAVAAIERAAQDVYRYPDGNAFVLKETLVSHYSDVLGKPITFEQITVGNGSNDILELVARAFLQAGNHAVYSQHAFAVYAIVCKAIGARPTVVPAKNWGHDLDAMLEAIRPETKVVFIANPNNPTGTWFEKGAWEAFIEKVPPNVIVVLDEAYAEYIESKQYPLGVDYLDRYPNLVVSKTFSKIYGIAGLRVGYGLSSPKVADYLNRVRQPFNVNHIAIQAAVAALGDQPFLERSREANVKGLDALCVGLHGMELSFIPSVANFICININRPAALIYERLLRNGVIVRPVDGYGMPNFLRVSVGTQEEIEEFLQALKRALKPGRH